MNKYATLNNNKRVVDFYDSDAPRRLSDVLVPPDLNVGYDYICNEGKFYKYDIPSLQHQYTEVCSRYLDAIESFKNTASIVLQNSEMISSVEDIDSWKRFRAQLNQMPIPPQYPMGLHIWLDNQIDIFYRRGNK